MNTATSVRSRGWWRPTTRLVLALMLPLLPVTAGVGAVAAVSTHTPSCATPHQHGIPERISEVAPTTTAPTAVDNYPGADDEPLRGAIAALRRDLPDFRTVASGVLPASGLDVEIRSDGPVEISLEELDRLTREVLRPETPYGDATVDAWMACNARRVLDEQVLAGRRLRILLPSDPQTCFRAARFTTDPHGGCDSHGVSLPEIDAKPRFLGFTLARLEAPPTIVVAPGEPYAVEAATRTARLLVHEFVHHVDNALGNLPWNGSLRRYEQRAYFVERTLVNRPPLQWRDLPRPVRFPAGLRHERSLPAIPGVR